MRISLPDRPGALGAVATALGAAGADIQSVEIVQRDDNHAVDDFIVDLPPTVLLEELLSACHAVPDTRVLWVSRTVAGSLVTDVELLDQLLAEPARALQALTDATPRLFHSTWAMAMHGQTIVAGTDHSPPSADFWHAARTALGEPGQSGVQQGDLAPDWLPGWPETTIAVVTLGEGQVFVAGRTGGPKFLDSELARLHHLVALVRPQLTGTGSAS